MKISSRDKGTFWKRAPAKDLKTQKKLPTLGTGSCQNLVANPHSRYEIDAYQIMYGSQIVLPTYVPFLLPASFFNFYIVDKNRISQIDPLNKEEEENSFLISKTQKTFHSSFYRKETTKIVGLFLTSLHVGNSHDIDVLHEHFHTRIVPQQITNTMENC